MKLKHASYRFIAILFSGIILLLQACGPDKPGTYKNDQIPSGTASKLHSLNNALLTALKANDPEGMENLMSQELIANREWMSTSERASNHMKEADYGLLFEYLIVNEPVPDSGVIKERNLGVNNFDYTYSRGVPETYIAFFTAKSAPQKWLITALYNKYDYGWKISSLEFNLYAENGLTAPESAKHAAELLKKGYWLDASNTASFAVNCIRPASNWKYVNEQAVFRFNAMALETVMAHYKLPLTIKQVPTHPRIWRIRIERNKEGAFPNVNYLSTIKLTDTVALKKENEAIGKVIGSMMTGIDKDKKYIYYTIYNVTPKGVPVTDHYDLRQKLQ